MLIRHVHAMRAGNAGAGNQDVNVIDCMIYTNTSLYSKVISTLFQQTSFSSTVKGSSTDVNITGLRKIT